MKPGIAVRITAGVILIAAGLFFYAQHLLDHQWSDAHFIVGALIALLGVWIVLSRSRK